MAMQRGVRGLLPLFHEGAPSNPLTRVITLFIARTAVGVGLVFGLESEERHKTLSLVLREAAPQSPLSRKDAFHLYFIL